MSFSTPPSVYAIRCSAKTLIASLEDSMLQYIFSNFVMFGIGAPFVNVCKLFMNYASLLYSYNS